MVLTHNLAVILFAKELSHRANHVSLIMPLVVRHKKKQRLGGRCYPPGVIPDVLGGGGGLLM
jgi:hypothetical protein